MYDILFKSENLNLKIYLLSDNKKNNREYPISDSKLSSLPDSDYQRPNRAVTSINLLATLASYRSHGN